MPRPNPCFAQRRYPLLALAALSALAAGCAFPQFRIIATPRHVGVLAGESAEVLIVAEQEECEPADLPCVDVTGRVLEYVLEGVPTGVGYSIDTSLRSPSTPGVVRVRFDAGPEARAGVHTIVLHATLDGRSLGHALVTLRIFSAGGFAFTAPPSAMDASLHTLVLLNDGALWGWGRNGDGQIGVRDRGTPSEPGGVPISTSFQAVSAGVLHTLALDTAGRVWVWGGNGDGELGPFRRESVLPPVFMPGLEGVQAVGVAAGWGWSLALAVDGAVWAWGSNNIGQLGERCEDIFGCQRSDPAPIEGVTGIQAIAAGDSHALALDAAGGVWTWGNNNRDQLGRGGSWAEPRQVPNLPAVFVIAGGRSHSLALEADGTVWAWGGNYSGQLGDGTTADRERPRAVPGLPPIVAIAAGDSHSLALATDGSVWAWGENESGQLGDGTDAGRSAPARIEGLDRVQAIAAGKDHSLAIQCGQVWTWGANEYSQLARGWQDDRLLTPGPAAGIGEIAGCGQLALRVSTIGTGEGSVTAEGADLACEARVLPCTDAFAAVAPGTAVALTASAVAGSTFESWAVDCQGGDPRTTVVMDTSKTCVARFRLNTVESFLLSVVNGGGQVLSSGGGILGPDHIDCGATCATIFPVGTDVLLAAENANGFGFLGWSGDCSGDAAQTTVTMDRRRTCGAEFRPFTLTVASGPNGTVTSDPPGLDCGSACRYTPRAGAVTLTALPDFGYELEAWGGDCAGSGRQATVIMDADKSCTASFRRIPGVFFLNMVVEGQGTATSDPVGIACPPDCTNLYPAGAAVTLTATPQTGRTVLHWLDDCPAPGVPTNQVVMDSDKTCRVVFTDLPGFPVARFTLPPGPPRVGQVVLFDGSASCLLDPVTSACDPAGIRSFAWDFDADGVFEASGGRAAASIAQYAFQAAGDQAVRLRVEGGPTDAADDAVETIPVRDPAGPLHGLAVAKAGDGLGSTVTDPPGLIGCDRSCAGAGPVLLEDGTTLTLAARAEPGSTFAGWSGPSCTSGASSIQVTMTGARNCTATFLRSRFELSVTHNGNGRVTSSPVGIDCGADCSEPYVPGTPVTLTATPDPGFVFSGWTGCDSATAGQCSVTMNADRPVSASFARASSFLLQVLKTGLGTGSVVSVAPPGIDCGADCSESFPAGTLVFLEAAEALGSSFLGWVGCDEAGGRLCSLEMTRDRTVIAEFGPPS